MSSRSPGPPRQPSHSARRSGAGLVLSLLLLSPPLHAQAAHPDDHALGTVTFPVSCSLAAQAEFTHAVALLHHMTYPEARLAFEQVAATDSTCAMAQWGIAMTLFQPLWPTRPGPEALARGWSAVERARALNPPTERERLFVAAVAGFFQDPSSTDYWARIRRWGAGMERVYTSNPDDAESEVFYALSLLATAPTDTSARVRADSAAAILLRVYQRNPEHPGAMHYLIHANDMPGRQGMQLEVTRRYELVAPDNPHALHMPTHIYTRLGDWPSVVHGNLLAADAALHHPAGEHGELVWDEFPHAIEYLVYGYLQEGRDDSAAAQLARLRGTTSLEPSFKTAFHLSSIPARCALERRDWKAAAGIEPRQPSWLDWNRFAWPEAISVFARGLGAAHLGRRADAAAAGERLEVLEDATRQAGEELFARNIGMLRLELAAWRAQVAGRNDSALALMNQAVALEAATPKHAVTPAPTLPAAELLGDLLLEQRKPREALAAYRQSLEAYPHRFNSLLGAARAARALHEDAAARGYYRELLEVAGDGDREVLKEVRRYAAGGQ